MLLLGFGGIIYNSRGIDYYCYINLHLAFCLGGGPMHYARRERLVFVSISLNTKRLLFK